MALAHQSRTIAIASDFRVDGAKSPEVPQNEVVWAQKLQPEIAKRLSIATINRNSALLSLVSDWLTDEPLKGPLVRPQRQTRPQPEDDRRMTDKRGKRDLRERERDLMLVTTFTCQDWVLCGPAAFLKLGSYVAAPAPESNPYLLPSWNVVAMSQAPSPKSNP